MQPKNLTSGRPLYTSTPLPSGLTLPWDSNFVCEEKMDGVFHIAEISDCEIAGELMRDGGFFAFDLLRVGMVDKRRDCLRSRLEELEALTPQLDLKRPSSALPGENFGQFLRSVIDRGGEGVVLKHLGGVWGDTWTKCKRSETFDLIVAEKHPGGKSSVRVAETSGDDRGWVPCRKAFDSIEVGMIIEISGFGLTPKGKIREPRFVRIREDKMREMAVN